VPVQGVHGWPSGPLSTPDDPKPGLVLVTPASIANSGGSASASGGAVTFTNVNSISLNGVFTSAFADYMVVHTQLSNTTGKILYTRLRASGTDSSTGYTMQRIFGSETTLVGAGQSSAVFWTIGFISNTYLAGGQLYFYRPHQAVPSAFAQGPFGYGYAQTEIGNGSHSASTSYDGFTLYPDAGNITGVASVYGIQR